VGRVDVVNPDAPPKKNNQKSKEVGEEKGKKYENASTVLFQSMNQ
jgi:hypothetical protein